MTRVLPEAGHAPLISGSDGATAREALAERLGWDVADAELLTRSLAHRSWCAETPGSGSNERLEFLGDAVLGLVVTDHLFRTYPDLPEGELAKVRASVVNSAALAEVAAALDVGDALLLGKGEGRSGGREKPSILADAMEAVIGAVYLDRGWEAAAELVMRLLGDRIEEAAAGPGGQDYKTRLQELCARQFDELPCTRSPTRAPTTPRASTPWSGRRPDLGHGARAGRRSRPSRRRPGWRGCGWPVTCRAAGAGRPWGRSRRSHRWSGGATVPELPEVETIRRDLEQEFVGRRIERSRSTGALHPPPRQPEEFIGRLEARGRRRWSGGGSTC